MLPAIVAALGEAGAAGAAGGAAAGGAASGASSAAAAASASEISAAAGGASGSVQQLTSSLMQMGGPGGAMSGAKERLSAVTGEFGKTLPILSMMKYAFKEFYETLTFIPKKILEVKQLIVSTGHLFVEAFAAPITTIKELGDAVNQFTRLSNPAAVKMFEYRVENTFATIGRILEPIMQALTRAAEKVGDTFAKLRGSFAPAMQGIEELIDLIMTRFSDLAETLAPAIQLAGTFFLGLVQIIKAIQEPITFLIRKFNELRRSLFEFLGVPIAFDAGAKSDIAIRAPHYTNTEAIQREMARNSLMASMGQQPEKRDVPSLLQMILNWLKENLSLEAIKQKIIEALVEAKNRADPRPDVLPSRDDVGGFFERAGQKIEDVRESALADFTRRRRSIFQES